MSALRAHRPAPVPVAHRVGASMANACLVFTLPTLSVLPRPSKH